MRERAAGARLAIAGGAAALGVVALVVLSQQGCFWHVCDPSTVELDVDGGTMLPTGQVQWQSSPDDGGPWLDFSGQRTFHIHFDQPFAGQPAYSCLLAADFAHPQSNQTQCGTLPQWIVSASDAGTTTDLTIFNPTCGEYGLNVLVTGFPAVPSDAPLPTVDAGPPGDASTD